MAFRLPDVSSGWCCSSSFPQAAESCMGCAVQLPQHLALPSSGDACLDDGRNKGDWEGTPTCQVHSFFPFPCCACSAKFSSLGTGSHSHRRDLPRSCFKTLLRCRHGQALAMGTFHTHLSPLCPLPSVAPVRVSVCPGKEPVALGCLSINLVTRACCTPRSLAIC